MKMIDEKWEDLNGRKHKLYLVRSMGAAQGFRRDRRRHLTRPISGAIWRWLDVLELSEAD